MLLWCRGLAVNAGLDVQITEPDVGPIQIQGPKSKEVMTDLFGADILDVPYYYMVHRELDGLQLVITRTGYSGELGYEVYLTDASRNGLKLWDAVIQAGEPHGLEPIGPCHIRRIEGGILAHGCDMTIDENPYEVGYGYKWMVELEQEQDFIGRDALREVSTAGVSRKLVGVELGGSRLGGYNDGSMPDFFPVRSDGETIGKVTSACHSPRLDKNIGYAMVPVEHSELGIELVIERPERDGRGRGGRPRVLQAGEGRGDAHGYRHQDERISEAGVAGADGRAPAAAAAGAPAPPGGRARAALLRAHCGGAGPAADTAPAAPSPRESER